MAAARPEAPLAPAPSSSPVKTVLRVLGSLFCVLVIVALNLVNASKVHHPSSAEAVGYLFGLCFGAYLFPLIVAFFYYRFRKRPKPSAAHRFLVISAWALVLALISTAGQLRTSAPLTQQEIQRHIGELAKQAAGQLPVSPDQTKWDGPIRSFFTDIKTFNESYMKEAAQVDNPALKSLYTADSFRTPVSVAQTLSQLHTTLDLDDKYASMQPIIDKFKQRIQATDASKSEKDSIMQGFEESARKSLEPREAAAAKEREWLQSSIELYEFIQANQHSYSVRGGKLIFKTTGLADEFNEKVHKATGLRSEFKQAQDAFHQAQNEKLGSFGLQPSDLGAPSHK